MAILKNACWKISLSKIFYIGFLMSLPLQLLSQTPDDPYVPALMPDRINLTVTQDPSSSMAVTWRTDTSIKASYAEILPSSPNPADIKKAIRIKSKTETLNSPDVSYEDLSWKGVTANYHSVVFKHLKPNTPYDYRVGTEDHWSEWFQFKTAKNKKDKVTFIYFGDPQTGLRSLWSKVFRQAYAHAPDAKVILYAGDIVNRGNRDEEWGEFFDAGDFIMAMIPNMPSPGNHDYGRGNTVLHLSSFWRPQFTLPENGPEGLEETCYFTDIQGVRFISLNTYLIVDLIQDMHKGTHADTIKVKEKINKYLNEQKVWLDSLLSHNPNQWTVITFHHPIFSPKSSRDNKRLREAFKPLFDKYSVDLVLQGHDHSYARGMSDIPMSQKGARSGTMYVVSVSGPKSYAKGTKPWISKSAGYKQFYQIISISGDTLDYKAYTVDRKVFDSFKLVKREEKINKLID